MVYMSNKVKKDTENELQELEEIQRILLDNSPDPIFAFNPQGRYLYVNRAFAEGVGKNVEQITGKMIWDVFDREEADKRYAALNHVFHSGEEKVIEVRVPRLDADKYFITTITPIFDSDGKVINVICSSKDITERKRAEMSLRESEEKYRAFFSTTKDSVFITSADGHFLDFNDAIVETFGYDSREELQKVGISNLYLDLDERAEYLKVIKEQGDAIDYPVDLRKKDGTVIKALINSVVRRDSTGMLVGYQGTIRDISESRRTEEVLKESEANYRLLIENQNDIVVKTDLEGRFLFVSPSYCNLFGKCEEELYLNTYTPLVHEDDLPVVEKAMAALFLPPYRCSYEERAQTVFGWRWIEWEAKAVFGERSKIIALVGTGRDITERKEMEKIIYDEKEKFKTTLLSVGDGVIVTDCNGNIELLNKIAEQLCGWTQEEAFGKPFEEVFNMINEFTRARCENPVHKVLETGNIVELANHTILISKDGLARPIEDSAAPIRDEKNEINGVVLVVRDFTEKKKRQEQIQYLSFHDQLTGLYNRRFFEEEFKRLDTERNLPITLVMADVNGLKLTNDAFGHALGDRLLKRAAELMKKECRADDIIARIGGDEFVILLPKTNSEHAAIIVKRINETISRETVDSILLSISFGWETKQEITEEITAIFKKAEDNMYRRKLSESYSMRNKTIKMIMKTLYEKNQREQQHSARVSQLCEAIGTALDLSVEDINELRIVGLMHDIGKITLDDRILDKDGNLGDSEWFEIRRHSETGYHILSSVNEFAPLAEYVLAHHERWDGKGYPKGLKGVEIPMEARIIAVADAYDAMTSDRPYRRALSKDAAAAEIEQNSGTQFDPDIVRVFLEKVLVEEYGNTKIC
jgi:diguanylate cyclase (GGDEF)-like protein/PAS domain S-box-containing protein